MKMLYCKKNVRFGKLTYVHLYIFERLVEIAENVIRKDMYITSGNDSKHRVGSKHFDDRAFDLRTRHLNLEEFKLLSVNLFNKGVLSLILFEWHEYVDGKKIKHNAKYGSEDYYDQFENYLNCKNKKVSHLHVEW